MNSTENGTHNMSRDVEQDTAPRRSEAGTAGWEDAVRLQRWATPDHADFYALAGEIVSTLYALDDVVRVLHQQVGRYGDGRQLYDDTRQVDPAARLADAATELAGLTALLQAAQAPANRFWSAVGHIGVELLAYELTDSGIAALESGTSNVEKSDDKTSDAGLSDGGEVSS